MQLKRMENESRTVEQLIEHYDAERELASKLRCSSKQERRDLYPSLYDELFERVPHHPRLRQRSLPSRRITAVKSQMALLRPFLKKTTTFMEVGAGDCAVSLEVAKFVKQVHAVDVCSQITDDKARPPNFNLVLSDGTSIPVTRSSVQVAYSHQLMEHLHPDDALEQLQNIHDALVPGGVYICVTPNRLSGPHDISRHFDDVATGLHLKEYTTQELSRLFSDVGFSRIRVWFGGRGKYLRLPTPTIAFCEQVLEHLPNQLARRIACSLPGTRFLGIRLVGWKGQTGLAAG